MEYSVSTLKTNTIQAATGTTINVTSGQVFTAPGHVLQVKQGTDTTGTSSTSTSYVSGGLLVQITPTSTSSKILVSFSAAGHSNTAAKFIIVDIARDPSSSTSVGTALSGGTLLSGKGASGYGLAQEYNQGGGGISQLNAQVLDSPSTTSQVTYLCVFRAHDSGTAHFNVNAGFASITAMEIAQ